MDVAMEEIKTMIEDCIEQIHPGCNLRHLRNDLKSVLKRVREYSEYKRYVLVQNKGGLR